MIEYTAALEALDTKAGRVHTIEDWRRVNQKAQRAPQTLTDDDIVILEGFGGEPAGAQARSLRAKAVEPPPSMPEPCIPAPARIRPRTQYVSRKELKSFAEKTAEVLVQVLKQHKEEIATLKTRVQELESRPHLKHCGVWRNGAAYTEGHLVTHAGALWLATTATSDQPGTPDSHWRLIVKSGFAR